jgi:hypothetical protein
LMFKPHAFHRVQAPIPIKPTPARYCRCFGIM